MSKIFFISGPRGAGRRQPKSISLAPEL